MSEVLSPDGLSSGTIPKPGSQQRKSHGREGEAMPGHPARPGPGGAVTPAEDPRLSGLPPCNEKLTPIISEAPSYLNQFSASLRFDKASEPRSLLITLDQLLAKINLGEKKMPVTVFNTAQTF